MRGINLPFEPDPPSCSQFPGRTQHAVENHLHKQKDIYAKLVSETITDVSDSSDDDALLAPAGGRARGPGMAPKWTEAEDAVLVQLLAQSPSKAQAYRDFIKRVRLSLLYWIRLSSCVASTDLMRIDPAPVPESDVRSDPRALVLKEADPSAPHRRAQKRDRVGQQQAPSTHIRA